MATIAVALAVTALRTRQPQEAPSPPPINVDGWMDLAATGHRVGPENATMAIVVFGDYQCPACKLFDGLLEQVLRDSRADVAVVYRHWPLPYHDEALDAAKAAECAGAQGRFLEYHRLLYRQADLRAASWPALAADAGIADVPGFVECLSSDFVANRVDEDIAAVRALGGRGTPTVLIDQLLFPVPPDSTTLVRYMGQVRSGRYANTPQDS